MYRSICIFAALIGLAIATTFAQDSKPEAKNYDADLATIDSVMETLYGVISGPAGERDWDRFRNLFIEDAGMGNTRMRRDGTSMISNFDAETYITRSGAYFLKNGFYESELSRRVEVFGPIAHVFSTYESRHKPDEASFDRGINSIQLVEKDGLWRIVSLFWTSETEDNPIPEKYLP